MKKLLSIGLVLAMLMCIGMGAAAQETGKWDRYCEEIGAMYNIQPEFLEAVIETESSGNPKAFDGKSKGLMQIYEAYHTDRMARLGVTDLYDPYGNILVGADILAELFRKYEDPAMVLNAYNKGEAKARKEHSQGVISEYSQKVLTRAAELEREHGK